MDAEAYDDAPCCRIEFDELEFTSPDDSSPTGGAFGEIRFAKLRYLPPSLPLAPLSHLARLVSSHTRAR